MSASHRESLVACSTSNEEVDEEDGDGETGEEDGGNEDDDEDNDEEDEDENDEIEDSYLAGAGAPDSYRPPVPPLRGARPPIVPDVSSSLKR